MTSIRAKWDSMLNNHNHNHNISIFIRLKKAANGATEQTQMSLLT